MTFPTLDAISGELSRAIVTPAERISQASIIGALGGLAIGVVLIAVSGAGQRAGKRPGDLWIWSTALLAPPVGVLLGQYAASRPAEAQ